MAVLEPDLAIAELQNGDPGETIGLLRGRSDVPVLLLVPEETPVGGDDRRLPCGRRRCHGTPRRLSGTARACRRQSCDRRDPDRQVRVRDLVIDEAGHLAWRGDQQLALTPTEFQILLVLARNADVVVSKRRLLSEVWGFDEFDVNVVEVHVSALRRKLEEFGPRLVETVRSHGYVIRAGRTSGRTAHSSGDGEAGEVRRLRGHTVGDDLHERFARRGWATPRSTRRAEHIEPADPANRWHVTGRGPLRRPTEDHRS